jgi:hypothetical protein
MKARKHRGGFAESMQTMKEIPATLQAVAQFFDVPKRDIRLTPYSFDGRKGWNSNTWLVCSAYGVLGMINEEVKHDH